VSHHPGFGVRIVPDDVRSKRESGVKRMHADVCRCTAAVRYGKLNVGVLLSVVRTVDDLASLVSHQIIQSAASQLAFLNLKPACGNSFTLKFSQPASGQLAPLSPPR
jgi:hypothetical protein